MDFGRNLQDLQRFLDGQNISWALIGGVPLAGYGIARTTLDLALAVDADAQGSLVSFMVSGPRGLTVPLAKPEHLIAMKVSAVKDDPGRAFQDLADIRNLARLPGVDHEAIRHHFERHGLLDRFRELERSL